MALRIGDVAPDFVAETTSGNINFHEFIGDSWCLFCSHPADFTPVCTTELGELSKRLPNFQKRNCKVIALSVDGVEDHKNWIQDVNETQHTSLTYPIIADKDRKISQKYGMLDQTNLLSGLPLTVRAVFIIDPKKIVRLILIYPASCGRNFDEIERVLDSLQLSSSSPVTTPADWKVGEDVIVAPNVDDQKAKELFGEFATVKPYLRFTKLSNVKKMKKRKKGAIHEYRGKE
eukprot:TRINITY_DN549_c0_g1_i1.p1 TRINITY_DN549_c0_g1~~TRINITY_DN549_c0_g1_i1.p1  ORF type:complete len:241 (-),score=49.97 TRINITY_DN549_c0_g1_i1:39-734(-)